MTTPDNKKKRENKNSETEKEEALAKLQNSFLYRKAIKADFLKNPIMGISPALLPKKDRAKVPTYEQAQSFGDHQLPLSGPSLRTLKTIKKAPEPIEIPLAESMLMPLPEKVKEQSPAEFVSESVSEFEPEIEPSSAATSAEELADKLGEEAPAPEAEPVPEAKSTLPELEETETETETASAAEPSSASPKPLTSFDFLDVGLSSKSEESESETQPQAEKPSQATSDTGVFQKAKSFLAHFAKKNKDDKKDE